MSTDPRLRVSIASARYLEAVEGDDQETLVALWDLAARDPELLTAFREIHQGLLEQCDERERELLAAKLPAVVEAHLTSGEVVRPAAGPVTISEVADELHRNTPGRLPPDAHALNERLRAVREPLPEAIGLSKLVAWGSRFGSAPEAYWKAFREAAIKLELRRAAEVEYQLAARSAKPKPEDRP